MAVNVVGTTREDLGYALKTWKRKVKSSGVLEQVKQRKEYIKPGVVRRKQRQRAEFLQFVRDQNFN